MVAGHIEEGNFNDTRLDGLDWALLLQWPGEIAQGNGTEQPIIDERADPAQREALRKILLGESTTPGATHFFVYNSTMSTVLPTLYAPIDLSIDVDYALPVLDSGRSRGICRGAHHKPLRWQSDEFPDQPSGRVRVHLCGNGQRQHERHEPGSSSI